MAEMTLEQVAKVLRGGEPPRPTIFIAREFARLMAEAIESAIAECQRTMAEPDGWVSVEDRLPPCSRKSGSFGVEVLIYPHTSNGDVTAFYGCRVTKEPHFYMYGAVIPNVTHWMPLPAAPNPTP